MGHDWLLPLLRFTSPALPIGAYAYSRALEHAVHAGQVSDEASAAAWIVGLLQHSAAYLDGPIFQRLHAAFEARCSGDVEAWNARLLATRESAELRLEDTQLAAAFARLLINQGISAAQPFNGRDDLCYATLFALAAAEFGVPSQPALLGWLWAQAESQCSAALRLVPLGQSAGQRLLSQCTEILPECARVASSLRDHEIGAIAPGLGIASALHESQYTRLFRS